MNILKLVVDLIWVDDEGTLKPYVILLLKTLPLFSGMMLMMSDEITSETIFVGLI